MLTDKTTGIYVYEPVYFIPSHQAVEVAAFKSLEAVKNVASQTYLAKLAIIDNDRVSILQFPEKMSANLHAFLKMGRPKIGFCCIDFLNYLHGRYSVDNHNEINCSEWRLSSFNELNLSSGDAVGLYDNMEPFVKHENQEPAYEFAHYNFGHFAVYLGAHVYLSLFGEESSLVFATVAQMQKFYSCNGVKVLESI